MKALIVLIAMLISIVSYSQTAALRMDLVTWVKFEPKSYLASGRVGTLEIKVRNYDVYQVLPSGEYYVKITNSRGSIYKMSLGYSFGTHEYQGNTVFFNSKTYPTKAWIWTVDRYGQLFRMDLPDSFARDARISPRP
jgi:hypothetical protein